MDAIQMQGMSAGQQAQAEQPADQQTEMLEQLRQEQEDEGRNLIEMIREAQEKAEAQRDALKVPKNTRYGDAPLEAYARLARAKTAGQVNSATGFARRKIFQLKSSLRTDADNATRIKAAISQLEKAVSRGSKKKRELNRERLAELRKARSEAQKKREEQALNRTRTQRMIRESGYMNEAVVADRLASQLTATQMELRQQIQQVTGSTSASAESTAYAAQQYTATVSAAAAYNMEAAMPAAGLSFEG